MIHPPSTKSVLSLTLFCGSLKVMSSIYTLPRLYVKGPLAPDGQIILGPDPAHYLIHVLRQGIGAQIRVFDGGSGEYQAVMTDVQKKSVTIRLEKQLRPQSIIKAATHLIFPPLKKEALDFLIEKATELGVDHFHPVLTARADVRKINLERILAQIIQAAEQCERLTLPVLHPLQDLPALLATWPATQKINMALEREAGAMPFARVLDQDSAAQTPRAFLIGPAGGWQDTERAYPQKFSFLRPVHLGENILRAETAAIAMLSVHQLGQKETS